MGLILFLSKCDKCYGRGTFVLRGEYREGLFSLGYLGRFFGRGDVWVVLKDK